MDWEYILVSIFGGLLKLIKLILIDFIVFGIIYWYGYVILMTLSFGRYPRGLKRTDDENFIGFFGVFCLLMTVIIFLGIDAAAQQEPTAVK
ncbi:hypothetical protein [Enterovibrio norvegicus]|uniref:hypothetical protein n=1 Tax=Enterovibrio norvegicus TaxID=188144 RepID=UPI000C842937|nr:hypothetical protein [Enterovibrio norvegicus]PML76088.1 hypothetical protein BCT69_05425 [Enterovibrio norvegicus]